MDEQHRYERRHEMLTWGFVALGVALRLFRYGRNFPLWGDESFVAVNFIARGYRDLLQPLEYGQICPVLFLWIERFAVNHLGFSEWSLRLFPLICGVASVWLFRHVAVAVVQGLPLLLAVAIFAVSFHPIRHAAEVKPYASDLLVALVLLAIAFRWRRTPDGALWLWLLVAAAPLAIGLSHPALFIAVGISLGLVIPVWKERRSSIWAPFLAYQLTVAGTFLGLYALSTRFQEQLALKGLRTYWAASFPPLDSLPHLIRWLVAVHTGTMFAYPGGGRGGQSAATFLAVVAGAAWLWRRGRRGVVMMLLAPFALALGAAVLRRYPYGVEARQMQFVAPAICLLAGLGAAWALQALPWRRVRRGLAGAVVLGLAGFALAALAGDLVRPYRFAYDQQTREFARRFWPALAREADVACLCADFGVDDRDSHHLRTALYLCNQWIYSPPRRVGAAASPRQALLSPRWPLRCVLYSETRAEYPQVAAWLAGMQQSMELRTIDRLDLARQGVHAGPRDEQVLVFEFIPRPGAPRAAPVVTGQGLHTGRLLR
jgi:hypothetical protein